MDSDNTYIFYRRFALSVHFFVERFVVEKWLKMLYTIKK